MNHPIPWRQVWDWGYRIVCGLGAKHPEYESAMYGQFGDFYIRCYWHNIENECAGIKVEVPGVGGGFDNHTQVFHATDRLRPYTTWEKWFGQNYSMMTGVSTYRVGGWLKHMEQLAGTVTDEQFEEGRCNRQGKTEFVRFDDSYFFTKDGQRVHSERD